MQAVTGKQVIYGFDTGGRPAMYLLPSRQNTDSPPAQLQFTGQSSVLVILSNVFIVSIPSVWMLERCIDLMGPGVETLSLLIDFSDRAKNPAIGTARLVSPSPTLSFPKKH